jgi:hypothetical protein
MRCDKAAWLLAVSVVAVPPPRATSAPRDERPTPDTTTLLAEVLENQNRVEEAREAYTYTMTVTDLQRSSTGETERGTERSFEVFHVAGRQFRRLTAEDGQPLTAEKAAKEERRVANAVRAHRSSQRVGLNPRPGTRNGGDVEPSDVLRLCRLMNPRREEVRGRPAVAYDFGPRPGAEPRGRAESWIARTEGRIWIDEQARRLLRLEVQVKRPLNVAGGIVVSVRPGSSLVFEQDRVNDEVWLPTYAKIAVSARVLLLKGVSQHQEFRFRDYRKFSVETSEEIDRPTP